MLRLDYGFQPIVAFRWRRPVRHRQTSERPRDQAVSAPPVARDPEPLAEDQNPVRGDSHYCRAKVLDWCRTNHVYYILGVRTDDDAEPALSGCGSVAAKMSREVPRPRLPWNGDRYRAANLQDF